MASIYNILFQIRQLAETLGKPCIVLVVIAVAGGSISCRKAATATVDRTAMRPTSEVVKDADGLYAERADLVKVRQAIVALRQAQADDPSSYDIAWRLAKYNYYLGAHTHEPTEQSKAFHEGVEAGKLAVQIRNDKPDGHFWLGANYGGTAQISTLSGFSEVDTIRGEMEAVLKIDERYQAGSAYMVMGQLYLEAPRLLGGDVNKAIEYLEKGIKVGPNNGMMRAKLAAAYAAAHRNDDARKQIEALEAMKPVPEYLPEHNDALAEAKKVEEKIK
jgi:tetratricopeptide (TPR) repeat protein